MAKTVLFRRNFRGFTGGHLKVWHYYNHVRNTNGFDPRIFFTPETRWDETNPWLNERKSAYQTWDPANADILFLGSMDWHALDDNVRSRPEKPIINLVQGVRHADPDDKRYAFLRYRAIRICVSLEVAEALRGVPDLNGPVFVIPNGIDLGDFRGDGNEVDTSSNNLLIVGIKAPELAHSLRAKLGGGGRLGLPGTRVEILTRQIPRHEFLRKMAQSGVTLFLPLPTEGFYLPALEGMATGTLVICPDCIGNRSFCLDDYNCLRPEYTEEAILDAVEKAAVMATEQRARLKGNALTTVSKYSLAAEGRAFSEILRNVGEIW